MILTVHGVFLIFVNILKYREKENSQITDEKLD